MALTLSSYIAPIYFSAQVPEITYSTDDDRIDVEMIVGGDIRQQIIKPVDCDDVYRQDNSDTLRTPSAPRKTRLRVRAKRIRLDDKMNAEIVSASQTLQTDSISHHGQSVAEAIEASDKVVGYNPPNLVWLFGLALVLLAAAFALVWYFKK